ncbi:MAG: cell envelope integrity protein TolA, partial [Pseudohongiellaceae bacterium]
IFNGYPLAIVVAVSLHVLLLAALLFLQGGNRVEALELVQPTVVKALFIDENPQVRNEQRRIQRQESERRAAEEAAARREREEAERRAAEEAARREREQAAAEAEAEARRQAALRDREELERQQRLEAERRQQELREAETERQRELAEAERRRQQEAERARQQQADAQAAAAAEASRNEFELVQSATGLIQQIIQESWRIPPSARNGMRAVLEIHMLPTGEVTDVRVTVSSGDPAFDREAENAVYRAQPFTELSDIPTQIFSRNFRTFSLTFEPDSLLN